MDDAFQQLDYTEISAQNINKKPQQGIIDTKSKGGLIRLLIFIAIGVILISCFVGVIVQNKKLSKIKGDIKDLQAEKKKQSDHLYNFTRLYSDLKAKKSQYEKSIDSLNQETKDLKQQNITYTELNKTTYNDLVKLENDYNAKSDEFHKLFTLNSEVVNNSTRVHKQVVFLMKKIDEMSEQYK